MLGVLEDVVVVVVVPEDLTVEDLVVVLQEDMSRNGLIIPVMKIIKNIH